MTLRDSPTYCTACNSDPCRFTHPTARPTTDASEVTFPENAKPSSGPITCQFHIGHNEVWIAPLGTPGAPPADGWHRVGTLAEASALALTWEEA